MTIALLDLFRALAQRITSPLRDLFAAPAGGETEPAAAETSPLFTHALFHLPFG